MKYIFKATLFIFVFLIVSQISQADSNQHFKAVAKPSKLKVKTDENFFIEFTVNIDKGWHIYGFEPKNIDPDALSPFWTEITVTPNDFWKIDGKITSTKPKIKYDSAFEMKVPAFYGKATFKIPVKATKNVDFNKNKLYVVLLTQQCTEITCLPLEEYKFKVGNVVFETSESIDEESTNSLSDDTTSEQIIPASSILSEKSKEELTESQQQTQVMRSRGLLSYIWFAMLQGAIALLTPCVFPMIPITVSFFTKRSEKKNNRGLLDSVVYAIGIIITFTGIGVLFAAIYGPSGIQNLATNPWLNLAIAAVFIIFALNLFGAFEIQMPTGLMNKLNTKSQEGSGIFSVLLMGLTFSLTSFTCTVPFVGTTLVSVGSGEWFYPIVGMLAFSLVFAAPFFLLALFPSALNKLPKAGGWMNNIKVVMGFLEIAAAVKFISNADLVWMWGIMPRELFLAIWIACTLMIILYILGIYRLHHDSPVDTIGTPRILFAVFFATITIYLFIGLFGKPLGELDAFLPPPDYEELMSTDGTKVQAAIGGISITKPTQSTKVNTDLVWFDNYEAALQTAKEQNKKLFIDFTGFTCTNCRWMELNMFNKPDVKALLSDMILVKLFTDRRQEPYLSNKQFQQERFNSIELPLYVLYTPDEELLATKAFTRDKQEFIDFLKK